MHIEVLMDMERKLTFTYVQTVLRKMAMRKRCHALTDVSPCLLLVN